MRNASRLNKKTSRIQAERSRIFRAALEPMEQRVMLSATVGHHHYRLDPAASSPWPTPAALVQDQASAAATPAASPDVSPLTATGLSYTGKPSGNSGIYSTSVNGTGHVEIEKGSTYYNANEIAGANGNGHSLSLEYQLYEFDAGNSVFPAAGSLSSNSQLNLNMEVYDAGEATTGNYAAVAGGFNVYFVPNSLTTTADSTLKFNNDVTGLVGQAGVSSADLIGTINFTAPTTAGYLPFTYNSSFINTTAGSDYETFLNDLNTGVSFRIAVAPNTATTSADALEGAGYNGFQYPYLSITDSSSASDGTSPNEILGLSAANYSVNENATAGTAVISVTRSGYLGDDASVNWSLSDGTAKAGTNYGTSGSTTPPSGTANFVSSPTFGTSLLAPALTQQSVATFSVPILDVGNMGGNKTFTVTLSSPSDTGGGTASLGQSTATVTIVNDPQYAAGTTLTSQSGITSDEEPSEYYSQGYAVVNGDPQVYAERGGTSGNSESYDSMEFLEFSPSTTPSIYPTTTGQSFTSLSSLSLQLSNADPGTGTEYSSVPGNFDVFFVPNTDAQTATTAVQFEQADPTGLINPQGQAVGSNQAGTLGSSGQAGFDPSNLSQYLLGTFSFDSNTGFDTFTAASIPSAVSTALLNDLNGTGSNFGIPGQGSAFRLVITPQTAGQGAIVADWNGGTSPTLSITGPTNTNIGVQSVAFNNPTYTVNETAGTATITLTRTIAAGSDTDSATVNYATSDGTAFAGTNYTATTGTATFAAGSTTTSFTVPITDVVNQGGNKVLNLTLTSPAVSDPVAPGPTGTYISLGSQSTATLTIKDSNNTGSNTEDLGAVYAGDSGDIEKGSGTYSNYELRPTNVGSFPAYAAMTFNSPLYASTFAANGFTGQVATAINSIYLDVYPESASYGPASATSPTSLNIYLVQDATSQIDPTAANGTTGPGDPAPHVFDTTVTTGTYAGTGLDTTGTIDTTNNFGTPMLLGTVTWTAAEQATFGSNTVIPLQLANYTPATEAILLGDLNSGASFRLIATNTPGTTGDAANWVGTSDTAVSTTQIPALDVDLTYATPSATPGITLAPAAGQSSSSSAGTALSFTATLTGGVPDGEVVNLLDTSTNTDVSSANQIVATGVTSGGTVTFSVPASTLPVGTDSLVAVYAGDSTHLSNNSNTLNQTVSGIATTNTLSAAVTQPTSTLTGTALTFTAIVNGSGGVANGDAVTLVDTNNGNAVVATGYTTGGNGTVTFTVPASTLAAGTHVLKAEFAGASTDDPFYAGSNSSTFTQTIVSASTTNTLAAQGGQATVTPPTQVLTFTATLTGGVPDGETVSLLDTSNSNAVVATATTSSHVATFTIPASTLAIGTHALEAVYYGDATKAGSVSSKVTQYVAVAPTVSSTQVGTGAVQRSTVNSISVTFNEAVTLGTGSWTLYEYSGGSSSGTQSNVTADVTGVLVGNTLTISPNAGGVLDRTGTKDSGLFTNGVYQLVLNGTAITDAATGKAALSSSSSVPVSFANAIAADSDTSQYFGVLYGDALGKGTVNNADAGKLAQTYNLTSSSGSYNTAFDYNGQGTTINNADAGKFAQDYNETYTY